MDTLKLASSNTKKRLLALFFDKPDERYYVRQLARMLNISAGTIHREVKAFEKSGILKSEKLGNSVFYQANKDYYLYPEIKSLVLKTIGIQGSLKSIITSIPGIEVAFIYGSYAKGQENKESDVDFYIIGSFDNQKLSREIYKLQKTAMRDINYSYSTRAEWQKRIKTGDSFILGILNDPKIILKGDENELR